MKPKRRPRAAKPAKPTATIRKASLAELESFYAMRLYHYVAELGGEALAMATLNRANGRLWGWLDVKEGLTPRQRVAVVWALLRGIRRINHPIYVTSNEGVHERAIHLLRAIGFRATSEIVNGRQVWVSVAHADPDIADQPLEGSRL